MELGGANPITKRLLEFWFKEEHILPDGSSFKFWQCQREGIEVLIYIYEVCKYRSLYDLARGFKVSISVDPTRDLWPKYCFKMATGSGKTWVMALTMVWQYFVETKGMEGVDVPIKDREAQHWCGNVRKVTGETWKYLKVKPQDLETYKPQNFRTLAARTEVRD